jgi:hypothetical protein
LEQRVQALADALDEDGAVKPENAAPNARGIRGVVED